MRILTFHPECKQMTNVKCRLVTWTKRSTQFRLLSGVRESKCVDPEGVVTNLFRPYAN